MNFQVGGKAGFYLDFDLIWKHLADKVKSGFEILFKMLDEAPKSKPLRVEFYTRRPAGISKNSPITDKSVFISTPFKKGEMIISPSNSEDLKVKTLSMLFWMMMEPNIFSVVKLPNGDNFLYMDIYSLYDYDYVQGGIDGGLDSVGYQEYQEYDDKFTKIFTFRDISGLLGYHNHELSNKYDNIIDYIIKEFKDFYVTFLDGSRKSNLFDLR